MKFKFIGCILWIAIFLFYFEQFDARDLFKCGSRSWKKGNQKTKMATFDSVLTHLSNYCQTKKTIAGCSQNSLNAMKTWPRSYENRILSSYNAEPHNPKNPVEVQSAAYRALQGTILNILSTIAKDYVNFYLLKLCDVSFSTQHKLFEQLLPFLTNTEVNAARSQLFRMMNDAIENMKKTGFYHSRIEKMATFFMKLMEHNDVIFELFYYYSDFRPENGQSSADVLEYVIEKYKERVLNFGLKKLDAINCNAFQALVKYDFIGFAVYMIERIDNELDIELAQTSMKLIIARFAKLTYEEIRKLSAWNEMQKAFMNAFDETNTNFKSVKLS